MQDLLSRRANLSDAKRALLEKRLRGEGKRTPRADAIPRAAGDGPEFPMSFAQEQMWIVTQLDPENPVYHVPIASLVRAEVDVAMLEAAFTRVVERHEALRTVFRMVGDELRQVVQPPHAVTVSVRDVRDRIGSDWRDDVRRVVAEEARAPIDIARGPLLRVALLRVTEERSALVITIHHIATDGWSYPLIMREVSEFYSALLLDREPRLDDPAIRYADFAVWQRQYLQGETLARLERFWGEYLAGAEATELPGDRPRPARQSFRGAFHRFNVDAETTRRLRALSRDEAATLNMILSAGFCAALEKHAGTADVVVGALFGSRTRPELEHVVGYFVNSAAIRLDLSGEPSFREAVRRARRVILDTDAHQDLPFEKVVELTKVERDPSRNPLFQVMYFHHTYVPQHAEDDGGMGDLLDMQPIYEENAVSLVDTGVSKLDLTMATLEFGDTLGGVVEYATDLYDAETVARFCEHFVTLLARASAEPDRPLATIAVTAADEARRLRDEWPHGPRHGHPVAPIHRLFEAQAARTPDLPALSYRGQETTYTELNARANRIARVLREMGAAPEVRIALALDRGPDQIAAWLGILKAGAAAVPIDPAYPEERRRQLLEDSGARLVVGVAAGGPHPPAPSPMNGRGGGGAAELAADSPSSRGEDHTEPRGPRASPSPLVGEGSGVGGTPPPHMTLDDPRIAAAEASDLGVDVDVDNAAYVIYTSGSTGRPKGVVVPHRGVGPVAAMEREVFGVGPGDRVLQLASLSFDMSVWEIAMALMSGGTLVVADRDDLLPGTPLAALLREERITAVTIPPTALAALPEGEYPDLRIIVSSGEAVGGALIRRWGEGRTFANGYGPTETTIGSTLAVNPRAEERPSIGRAFADSRVYVVDAALRLVPQGVPGELLVGGPGIVRGYLDRPGLTAAAFVPDPFSGEAGARLYRTGDRGRWRADGELDFLGRIDQQVKVRGFRIEPGEIEQVLREHPSVAQALVVARADEGHARLVGYVVPAPAETVDVQALRAFLSSRLPAHMVPAAWGVLDALPRTAAGKLDRRALPRPDAPTAAETEAALPHGQVEETLARVWCEVLRLERVGTQENFFTLGGDSILAIQMMARAGRAGIRLTPRQVFDNPTVAGLARVAGTEPTVRAEQGPVTGDAPLTPVQAWFFAQPLPAPHHWNMPALFALGRRVEGDALRRALEALATHHDALRMRFARGADGWRQHNAEPAPDALPLERVDLSAVADDALAAAIESHAVQAQGALDLERGPLARAVLYDCGAARPQRLLLAVHHLVVDAVSWPVLGEDLEAALAATAAGEPIALPRKTTSFREWAQRLEAFARSTELRDEAAYWAAAVPADAVAVPVDDPAAPDTEETTDAVFAELDAEETRALLQEVPAAYQTQINDVLLAALVRAFGTWVGRPSLVVQMEGHGREDLFPELDVSRTVGWFTSAFPVHLEANPSDGPGELLKAVKERLRAVPNRGIGYGILRHLAAAGTADALRDQPHPQVSFNYLGQTDSAAPADGALLVPAADPIGPPRAPEGPRPYRIQVDGAVADGRLRMGVYFGSGAYARATMERLADAYGRALRELIAHCRDPHAGGYTPSDFALAELDQEGLDSLLSQFE